MMWFLLLMCVFCALVGGCQALRNERNQREQREREELERLFHQ